MVGAVVDGGDDEGGGGGGDYVIMVELAMVVGMKQRQWWEWR